jgi:REP element-mobilizing transposase RayT
MTFSRPARQAARRFTAVTTRGVPGVVIASHLIFTAYGFWLPNDPRGSWSDFVGSWQLFRAGGKATRIHSTMSVAAASHDREARLRIKEALHFPPVSFNGLQARCIAQGFAHAVAQSGYIVYACAILPEHVHMVVARHPWGSKQIMGHLKRQASFALYHAKLHPFDGLSRPGGSGVSCWTERGWSVFLNSPDDVCRAVEYVENNPVKARFCKAPEDWKWSSASGRRTA